MVAIRSYFGENRASLFENQYYEVKEASQDLKRIVLQRIAEAVGDALGKQALEQLDIRRDDKPDTKAETPSGNFAMSANHG